MDATEVLYRENLVNDIDIQFIGLIERLSGDETSEELRLAVLLANHVTLNSKHTCLDLSQICQTPLLDLFPDRDADHAADLTDYKTPEIDSWTEAIKRSAAVGAEGEYKPLVLDDQNRLYLYRYWMYENELIQAIKRKTECAPPAVDETKLKDGLSRLFGNSASSPDWQKVAAFMALTRRFSLISGGPGTGKTHTVTSILALFLEQNPELRISICAPTGKAAARIQESITQSMLRLQTKSTVLERIPNSANTIHRLLGSRHRSPHFRHNANNKLTSDLIIVDEASMISLALMSRLFQAIRDDAVVILLGDRNQLSSVEAGAVLGDLCDAAQPALFSEKFAESCQSLTGEQIPDNQIKEQKDSKDYLMDSVLELQYSYRFEKAPVIGSIARDVNRGDIGGLIRSIREDREGTVTLTHLPASEQLKPFLKQMLEDFYRTLRTSETLSEACSAFEQHRVLCSHRSGAYGVTRINALIEEILQEEDFNLKPGKFYRGRPVIIKQNDYNLKLYNGDTGIVWGDERGRLKVYFPDRENRFHACSPARLPRHETAYAMTIHESQGSEFDHVMLVLPPVRSPILTRELLYTGITRARKTIGLRCNEDTLKQAVNNRVGRFSGLKSKLTV